MLVPVARVLGYISPRPHDCNAFPSVRKQVCYAKNVEDALPAANRYRVHEPLCVCMCVFVFVQGNSIWFTLVRIVKGFVRSWAREGQRATSPPRAVSSKVPGREQ